MIDHKSKEEQQDELARIIHEAREEAGVSANRLEEVAGVPRGFVDTLEHGHGGYTWYHIVSLCEALRLDVGQVMLDAYYVE